MQVSVASIHQLDGLRSMENRGPVMVMPYIDEPQARRAAEFAAHRAGTDGLLLAIHDEQRQGFIATVNQAFRATRSPWFGYMAQDAYAGRSWLALALKAMQAKQAGLLGFNDGKWQGQLASFGLADRAWAESNYGGDFFDPGYSSHYADTELTLIARQQGRYVYEPNSVLLEVDWHKESAAVNPKDRQRFKDRALHGFDGRVTDPRLQTLFG